MTEATEIDRATGSGAATAPLLSVRNIEVVYDDVILVLRGLSLDVPQGRDRRAARRQRRRQVDDAEGDLRTAQDRGRRSHPR